MLKTKNIVELWNILITQVNKEVLQNGKKKTHNLYLTNCNFLWQADSQILLTILLKEYIKLNVNMDTMIKNVKLAELNTKLVSVALNIRTLKNRIEGIYVKNAKKIKIKFDTSRQLPKGKKSNWINKI